MSNVSKEDLKRIEKAAEGYAFVFKNYALAKHDFFMGAMTEHLRMKAENEKLKEEVEKLRSAWNHNVVLIFEEKTIEELRQKLLNIGDERCVEINALQAKIEMLKEENNKLSNWKKEHLLKLEGLMDTFLVI